MPVVRVETTKSGDTNIKELLGSAFFIGSKGICISASHVLQQFYAKLDNICVLSGPPNGLKNKELALQISKLAFAPNDSDVCIFSVNHSVSHPFQLATTTPTVWQDVATYGYPLNITIPTAGSWWLNSRFLKGYIQRINIKDKMGYDGISNFETSFLYSKGFSGSPLFVHRGAVDEVIGVCVRNHRIEIANEVEEYGIAENLIDLASWEPLGYEGLSLSQLSLL